MEKAGVMGSYRILISGCRSVWNGQILHIRDIRTTLVAGTSSQVVGDAIMTVPVIWDNKYPVAVRPTFHCTTGKKDGKTVISGSRMRLQVNLSYKDGTQVYIFNGKRNGKGFSGSYTESGKIPGTFILIRDRS